MSETYETIGDIPEASNPQRASLTLINGDLSEPTISIDSLTDSRLNHDAEQIGIALVDNRKHFVGYTVAGADFEPTRETALRGIRNVLGLFEQYRPMSHVRSDELLKNADYLRKTKRTAGGVSRSLEEVLGDHDTALPQIFWRLVAENDPLITTLGVAQKYGYVKEHDMPTVLKETILAFHLDEFKLVIGARSGSRQKRLPSAS